MSLIQSGSIATAAGIGENEFIIQEALTLFNKKFKNFCSKSPLRLSFYTLPGKVRVDIETKKDKKLMESGKDYFEWEWNHLQQYIDRGFEDKILRGENTSSYKLKKDIIEEAVKQFVYDIRLTLAPHLPVLLYRKFNLRQLTPEEIANQMMKNEQGGRIQTHKYELVKEKVFVMEQVFLAKSVDNPKSLFSLSDEDGVRHLYKFKTGLVMPFLYKMWNNKMTPAELGKEFFTQAKLVSKKGEEIEQ